MNRLEKKCMIASGALHGFVALVLLFGAALMPRREPPPIRHITLFDPRLVTDAPTSGGTPMVVQQPPAQQPQSQSQPQAQPQAQPQPPVAEVHRTPVQPKPVQHRQPDPPKAVEPVQKVKVPSLRPEDMKMVKRTTSTTTTSTSTKTVKKPVEDNSAQEAAEAAAAAAAQRKRISSAFSSALSSISDDSTDARPINIAPGIGGGPLMANYRDLVASKYYAAWSPPPGIEDNSAKAQVRIVISRDGRVTHSEILRSSGNPAVDRSVQSTLERVTFIAPFPEGSSDAQRVYSLDFNLATKRMMG